MEAALRKPLLLKDYLMEDLGSCSSNGFRSYPRRQCCTTVRFLVEADLGGKKPPRKEVVYGGGAAAEKSAPTVGVVVSAIQRASKTVLNAVRSLQFSSSSAAVAVKSAKTKKAIVARRFSRKLLKRSSRKKTAIDRYEIERWKAYNQLMEKKSNPSNHNAVADSNSSTSETKSKTNSWSDSDFTVSDDSLQSSSCSSDVNSTEAQKDAVVATRSSAVSIAVTNKSVPIASTPNYPKKQLWSNEEEQFSPVSVLDCPFEDEDEVSSAFQDKLNLVQGSKNKLMKKKKKKRMECHTQLEPLNLAKRIAFSESETESPLQKELKPAMLLHQLKARTPFSGLKLKAADKLLLDFFRERIAENGVFDGDKVMVQAAEDWINGKSPGFLYEWEVKKNRQAYMEDMENGGGKWRKKMVEENEELALQMEAEVFTSLVNELLVDLSCV